MYLQIIVVFTLGYFGIAFDRAIKINKTATAIITGIICRTLFMFLPSGYDMTSCSPGNFPDEHRERAAYSSNKSSVHKESIEFTIPVNVLNNGNVFEFSSIEKKSKEDGFTFRVDSCQVRIAHAAISLRGYSKAIFIGTTKSDIIYPFHSFW